MYPFQLRLHTGDAGENAAELTYRCSLVCGSCLVIRFLPLHENHCKGT